MTNSIEQNNKEKFESLPDDAQEAIRSFDYDKKLQEVHKKHRLHIDQSYSLEQNVAMVIFGEVKPQDLIQKIHEDLRLDVNKSKEIAYDINTNILSPIQEIMKQSQKERMFTKD